MTRILAAVLICAARPPAPWRFELFEAPQPVAELARLLPRCAPERSLAVDFRGDGRPWPVEVHACKPGGGDDGFDDLQKLVVVRAPDGRAAHLFPLLGGDELDALEVLSARALLVGIRDARSASYTVLAWTGEGVRALRGVDLVRPAKLGWNEGFVGHFVVRPDISGLRIEVPVYAGRDKPCCPSRGRLVAYVALDPSHGAMRLLSIERQSDGVQE